MSYFDKVVKIAEVKYDLPREVVEVYEIDIRHCEQNGFTPRRTVEYLAEKIF